MSSANNIVCFAASAGGLEPLMDVLSGLPADFPAPIVVVQHLAPKRPSFMAAILNRCTKLKVSQAVEGDVLEPGHVYLAPPNKHLLINADGRLGLSESATVHFVRPCADVMFESIAQSFTGKTVAVVLSGSGKDGADGVRAIKEKGGQIIVQDELSSKYSGMPHAAIETGDVDYILPAAKIAEKLISLMKSDELV